MKAAVFGVALTVASAAGPDDVYDKLWAEWQQKYYPEHVNTVTPDAFKKNVDFIRHDNQDGYELSLNQFADLSNEAFRAIYAGTKVPANRWGGATYLGKHVNSGNTLADSVDWSDKGAVTPIKNQGSCGSCWAFSTTGSLEGAWQIATGNLVAFSEQQLVDCDKGFGDQGCNGGLMDNAFKYLEQDKMCTEDSYKYTGRGSSCAKDKCTVGIPAGGVTGYKDVKSNSEPDLISAINSQPVSVAVCAATTMQLYHGGILSSICGTMLDHGVLAVGYGTDGGKNYFKVKNSWGLSWGEKGYIRMARGKSGGGQCGILKQPSYPVVKKTAVVV